MVIGNTLMFVVLLELRCSISTRLFDSIPIFWNHTDTNEILTLIVQISTAHIKSIEKRAVPFCVIFSYNPECTCIHLHTR